MDMLVRNVHLEGQNGLYDVSVNGGLIADVMQTGNELLGGIKAQEEIDGRGGLLVPPFVDGHTHLDKTMLSDGREFPSLKSAIEAFNVYCDARPSKEDVKNRARRMLRMALANGTLFVRTHTTLWGPAATTLLEALCEVREEFADRLTLQIFPMVPCYGEPIPVQAVQAMHEAAALPISGFGCAAHMSTDPKNVVDTLLEVAGRHNLLADFHVDENDRADITSLKHICTRMEQEPLWQGKVTAGHICALSNVPHDEASETIARMARVGLHAIVMASCNLYLMGRADTSPVRRGITRVRQLVGAGVNVACASDNVRDYFRPFGNADILEEALITAQVAQMGTPSELAKIFRMGTYNGAKLMRLEGYGLEPGCKADMVLLDAPSSVEALLSQAAKRLVIKGGKVIVRTEHVTEYN